MIVSFSTFFYKSINLIILNWYLIDIGGGEDSESVF